MILKYKNDYAENGYIIIKEAIKINTYDRFLCLLKKELLYLLKDKEFNNLNLHIKESMSFNEAFDYFYNQDKNIAGKLFDIVHNKKLLLDYFNDFSPRIIASLIWGGNENDYVLQEVSSVLRIDPPSGSPQRLGWHQEGRYIKTVHPFFQMWSPLIYSSSLVNGSTEIACKSHKIDILDVSTTEVQGLKSQQYLIPENVVNLFNHKIIEINPRDVLIFDHRLIHRSSKPQSQKIMKFTVLGSCTRNG